MKLSLIILAGMIGCGGSATAYMQSSNPAMLRELLVKADVFGISAESSYEKRRVYAIDHLDIPFEQRDTLKNRTVFLGASREMVVLAIGEPKKAIKTTKSKHGADEVWVYYFKNSSHPTMMYFSKDKLSAAEQGSALDITEAN